MLFHLLESCLAGIDLLLLQGDGINPWAYNSLTPFATQLYIMFMVLVTFMVLQHFNSISTL